LILRTAAGEADIMPKNKSPEDARGERLQVMLTADELRSLDDFRFKARMPSRAAAIREILRRGLAADGFKLAAEGARSNQFGVMNDDSGS
jgi:hypothetical protein